LRGKPRRSPCHEPRRTGRIGTYRSTTLPPDGVLTRDRVRRRPSPRSRTRAGPRGPSAKRSTRRLRC
jgi:hypothetical protein